VAVFDRYSLSRQQPQEVLHVSKCRPYLEFLGGVASRTGAPFHSSLSDLSQSFFVKRETKSLSSTDLARVAASAFHAS
jgi:hypothetical protein